jgi:hypothetical protein
MDNELYFKFEGFLSASRVIISNVCLIFSKQSFRPCVLDIPKLVRWQLTAPLQPVWTFDHLPGSGEFLLNRETILKFDGGDSEQVVHVLAGYFKATLHGSVKFDNIHGRLFLFLKFDSIPGRLSLDNRAAGSPDRCNEWDAICFPLKRYSL